MDGTVQYASFWKRFNAYGVDVILLQCVVLAFMFVFFSLPSLEEIVQGSEAAGNWFDNFTNLNIALSAVYNILMVSGRWQATLGKRSLHCLVVTKEGARLTLQQSAIRHLASGISMLLGGLGYITVFFNPEKAALHDILCNTRVIVGKIE